MNVTIKERKSSFTSEYDIEAPGVVYYARKTFFAVTDHLEVKTENGALLATIEGFFSPIRNKHDFILEDGRTYRFQTEKLWTQVFSCNGPDRSYTVYQHRGLKCSVFEGDRQIAAFEKNRVAWLGGNEYDVAMDSDADLLVVICMVLTINTEKYDEKDDAIKVDFGSLGPQGRPFDDSWQPR